MCLGSEVCEGGARRWWANENSGKKGKVKDKYVNSSGGGWGEQRADGQGKEVGERKHGVGRSNGRD